MSRSHRLIKCVLCTSLYTIDQSRQPIKRLRKKGSRNFDPVDISATRAYNKMTSDYQYNIVFKSIYQNRSFQCGSNITERRKMKLIAYNWLLIYYETLLTATSFLLIIKDKLINFFNIMLYLMCVSFGIVERFKYLRILIRNEQR